MINSIITFILLLDFLQRRFPKKANKIKSLGSNIYIIIYSYFEVQMKKYGIDIFYNQQNEKSYNTIEQDKVDKNYNKDTNDIIINNKEIWDLVNKHRTLEKEKYF